MPAEDSSDTAELVVEARGRHRLSAAKPHRRRPLPGSEAAAADGAAAPETPAEPELVEVWRPGGRSEERAAPRHDRNRHRRASDRRARRKARSLPPQP